MDNLFFENEYTMEKKFFKEYVYKVLSKKTIYLGLIIFILGMILFILIEEKPKTMLVFAILSGIVSILTPILIIKQLEETSKRLNNGKIEKTNVKFLNNIIMDEGKVHLEFEYSQINKIMQTKNFIVLKISNESAILVFKCGFIKGNEEEFLKFIEEKIKR